MNGDGRAPALFAALILGIVVSFWITEIVSLMKAWFDFGLLDGTYFAEVPVLIKVADLWLIGLLSAGLCLRTLDRRLRIPHHLDH